MTDNEIINELNLRIDNFSRETLDLIKRQKEKIKEFDEKLVIQRGLIDYQKAEIERLEKAGEEAVSCFTRMESLYKIKCNELEVAKSEAIKEFAERLENNLFGCDVTGDRDNVGYISSDVHRIIDNLVKEMTEKKNDFIKKRSV